jgi:hypothetical protein
MAGSVVAGGGVISSHEVYSLSEFQNRVGFGRHAMKVARQAGLPVRFVASKGYVVGSDAVEFFSKVPAEQFAALGVGGDE